MKIGQRYLVVLADCLENAYQDQFGIFRWAYVVKDWAEIIVTGLSNPKGGEGNSNRGKTYTNAGFKAVDERNRVFLNNWEFYPAEWKNPRLNWEGPSHVRYLDIIEEMKTSPHPFLTSDGDELKLFTHPLLT